MHDREAAQSLYDHGNYGWRLFDALLVIEKVLKAFWVRDSENPAPFIHTLCDIAKGARPELTEEQIF